MRAVAAKPMERLAEAEPGAGDVPRIHAENGRSELGVKDSHGGRGGGVTKGLTPAFNPLVRYNAQPDGVHGLPVQAAHHGGFAPHIEWGPGPVGFNSGYFHGAFPICRRLK